METNDKKTAEEIKKCFKSETGFDADDTKSSIAYISWLEKQVRELNGQTIRYREFCKNQFTPVSDGDKNRKLLIAWETHDQEMAFGSYDSKIEDSIDEFLKTAK